MGVVCVLWLNQNFTPNQNFLSKSSLSTQRLNKVQISDFVSDPKYQNRYLVRDRSVQNSLIKIVWSNLEVQSSSTRSLVFTISIWPESDVLYKSLLVLI